MDEKIVIESAYKRIKREKNICRWLKSILICRDNVEEILDKAKQEYNGFHVLPGTMNQPHFVGNPPQWYENPVGDEEYVWVLNRVGYWKDFIIAYVLTDKKEYARKILSEMMDWIEKCPCPKIEGDEDEIRLRFADVTPWRSLEGGIRMFDSWPVAVRFLVQEDYMDLDQFSQVVLCIIAHARMLMTVPPILWPDANHNHYLMENLGLFFVAQFLRELPEADSWGRHASQELIRCVENQLTEDGGQIEGSPSYHNQTVIYFCKWILASNELQLQIPERYLKRIKKALDYSVYTVRPTGVGVPFGDSDPEYSAVLAALAGYQTFDSRRWISILTPLVGSKKVLEIYEQNPFEFYNIDCHEFINDSYPDNFSTISWQKQLSQAMIRTDWGKDALSIFFACKIPCQNGHSHIDPASFDFSAYGKTLIVDPGRYTYREDDSRRQFKSATMHNTLTLDGKEPFEYETRWSFSGERDGCIYRVDQGDRYMMAIAVHTSYFPTIHERLIAIIDKKFLIVWDRLTHKEGKNVNIWYHLDSTDVKFSNGIVYTADKPGIALCGSNGLDVKLKEGKISDKMDVYRKSTRVCFTDNNQKEGQDNYLCILYPFSDKFPELLDVQVQSKGRTAVASVNEKKYIFEWDDDIFAVR